MKIRSKSKEGGESRELLLKEYFLNAYLIAVLKQVGEGVRLRNKGENSPAAGDVKIHN